MKLPELAGPASTLPEQLHQALLQAIITGDLGPGERLHADEIAEHFGVSRIPVREALRSLSADGWIELRPRYGAYIRQRSEQELNDLFETRIMLEGQAIRLAAQRRTGQQLEELTSLVEVGRKAAGQGDSARIEEINTAFHEVVGQSSGNEVVADILRTLGQRVRWYFSTVSMHRGHDSMEEHALIVDRIRERDADGAAALIMQHIESTWDEARAAVLATAVATASR